MLYYIVQMLSIYSFNSNTTIALELYLHICSNIYETSLKRESKAYTENGIWSVFKYNSTLLEMSNTLLLVDNFFHMHLLAIDLCPSFFTNLKSSSGLQSLLKPTSAQTTMEKCKFLT